MNVLSKINHIPFKYVLGMNIAMLVMAITFISINSVNQTTDNRSKAAETPLPSPRLYITVDPASQPQLLSSDPDWAKVGDALLIRGKNLGNLPFGVMMLGDTVIPSQNIVEWAPDHIVVTIPEKATSNPLIIRYNDDQELRSLNTIRIVQLNEPGL